MSLHVNALLVPVNVSQKRKEGERYFLRGIVKETVFKLEVVKVNHFQGKLTNTKKRFPE